MFSNWQPWWDVVAIVVLSGALLAVWALRRSLQRRNTSPAHNGADEHPIGSEPNCPACTEWKRR